MPDFLTLALNESQKGRRVFPCKGKLPAVQGGHGVLDATDREEVIIDWSGIFPDANVGIGFFDDSSEVGVDIDVKNIPQWREYEVKYGPPETRTVRTGGGGYHYYFKRPAGIKLPNIPQAAGKGFELKSNATYLIAPGSVHPETKKQYELVKDVEPSPMPEWLIKVCLNGAYTEKKAESSVGKIPRGQHDHFLTSQAGSYRRRGDSKEIIIAKLRIDLDRLEDTDPNHPYTEKDLERIANSVSRYPVADEPQLSEEALNPPTPPVTDEKTIIYNSLFDEAAESDGNKSVTKSVSKAYHVPPQTPPSVTKQGSVTKPLAEIIEEWVRETTSWFSYEDIDKELGITSKDKANRRNIIKRLRDSRLVESHPSNNKLLRYIDGAATPILYKEARGRQPLDIKFPFGIENYFNCYSKNIIVVAGAPDAGKTAWLLNFIRMNQHRWNIFYESSEMGDTELATRLEQFPGMDINDWNFSAEERSSHFADCIRPDDINVIDYMELTSELWMVAEYLREIHDRLRNGIAIVALQKKRGAELGRGGEFSLEKPRLYLSMDAGKMTIQKAKNWATSENPNKMFIKYKIVKGCEFHITDSWQHEEDT